MCNILFFELTAFRKVYGLVKTLLWIWGLRALLIQKSVKLKSKKLYIYRRLRALLIQESVKLHTDKSGLHGRLRALLIQKSVKLLRWLISSVTSLRALLIQKSVKLFEDEVHSAPVWELC